MYSRFICSDSSAGSREEKVRRSSLYKYLLALLILTIIFVLSAGYASATVISAKVKEFKVGPEGKWIIVVDFTNHSKDRAITALGYKVNFEYDGKKRVISRDKDNYLKLNKPINPGKKQSVNFKTSAPMNSSISNVKISSLIYRYKKYTAPKKQTAKKSSSSGYSIKNVRAGVRNLDYKTFRIDVHFDVLNNRNNASVLRVDDIVVSFSLKNRDVPTIHKRYRIGSKKVRIKPLGSHRFRFNFKVEDPYAGQAGSYTLTNVRVSAKPRFGQTQNRNNSGNRVIIIQ